MAISIRSLWSDSSFGSLTRESQLLYIYFSTLSGLNALGIVKVNPDVLCKRTSYSLPELRDCCLELQSKGLVKLVEDKPDLFLCLPKHPYSLPSNLTLDRRLKEAFKTTPKAVTEALSEAGVLYDIEFETALIETPTIEEIQDYCLEIGVIINAKSFFDFYEEREWKDSNGKRVKSWKGKFRSVWAQNGTPIPLCKNAPKGFERFYVKNDESIIFADSWRDGKPYSKSGFASSLELQEEYKVKTKIL